MPPRYAYWTIIAGGLPTAFRAAEREELLPTFSRIKQKHPDAQLKWFARGKLWDSPESARREVESRWRAEQSRTSSARGTRGGETRGRDWRPGGAHRDPRQKYRDAKKARNAEHRQRRFERRQQGEHAARPRWDRSAAPQGRPADGWRKPRRFEQKSFGRNQDADKRAPVKRNDPNRKPRPHHENEPTAPPRPSEPTTPPPGPPERARRDESRRRKR